MIIPLVSEAEWIDFLQDLPIFELPESPALIVVPHPDDETLATGGLISTLRSRGLDVLIASVTDGEKAYENSNGLGELRQSEQTLALSVLEVTPEKTIRMHVPDSHVATHEQELVERLSKLASHETHIFAPWLGDFHPDHEACGRAAESVAHQTGARLTYYLFWTWHRGTLASLDREKLSVLPLSQTSMLKKAEALRCHESQLSHPSGKPILSERLLAPAKRVFEVFLTT